MAPSGAICAAMPGQRGQQSIGNGSPATSVIASLAGCGCPMMPRTARMQEPRTWTARQRLSAFSCLVGLSAPRHGIWWAAWTCRNRKHTTVRLTVAVVDWNESPNLLGRSPDREVSPGLITHTRIHTWSSRAGRWNGTPASMKFQQETHVKITSCYNQVGPNTTLCVYAKRESRDLVDPVMTPPPGRLVILLSFLAVFPFLIHASTGPS